MRISISTQDITTLLTACTWSGDRTQAARKLEFSFVQSVVDSSIPVIECDCGMTVYGYDEDNNLVFRGNIYKLENDREKSTVKITAYDNLFVLNKSKTTRKYTDALPEDIAAEICAEMGIGVGEAAKTGERVSFIANAKTGYQIIQGAYTEAHKKNEKIYQCIMRGNLLYVIEKGELCGVALDSFNNMMGSIYRKSIEDLINRVAVVDDAGNITTYISDDESISQYSMFQDVYKIDKEKDTSKEAKARFKKPEREGVVVSLGDYRALSGYSLVIEDANFKGQFWIKSDVHNFDDGDHTMRLQLEFENIMSEEKVEVPKK